MELYFIVLLAIFKSLILFFADFFLQLKVSFGVAVKAS
jgi:hypothetical protein